MRLAVIKSLFGWDEGGAKTKTFLFISSGDNQSILSPDLLSLQGEHALNYIMMDLTHPLGLKSPLTILVRADTHLVAEEIPIDIVWLLDYI